MAAAVSAMGFVVVVCETVTLHVRTSESPGLAHLGDDLDEGIPYGQPIEPVIRLRAGMQQGEGLLGVIGVQPWDARPLGAVADIIDRVQVPPLGHGPGRHLGCALAVLEWGPERIADGLSQQRTQRHLWVLHAHLPALNVTTLSLPSDEVNLWLVHLLTQVVLHAGISDEYS
jgi:hypothetical protein